MAFGDYATLRDNFDRADEGPPPSASWTTNFVNGAGNGIQVVSNQCKRTAAGWGDAYWNAATFGADAEAYVTVDAWAAGEMLLGLRGANPGSATADGYGVHLIQGSGAFNLLRYDNGTGTNIQTATQAISAGDKVGIEIIGSTIRGMRYSGGSWSQIVTATDSTYTATGYAWVEINGTSPIVNDFYAGTIAAAGGGHQNLLLMGVG